MLEGRLSLLAALAAALVVVPAPALASHNSVGAHASLAQPGELDRSGTDATITPDVAPDEAPVYHTELDEPRPAPADQSGDRYRAADGCKPASRYSSTSDYEADLKRGDACYVGYLDGRLEYMQFTQIFSIHRSQDLLYPVNPDDPYCTGHDDPEERVDGGGPIDETLASAERSASDPECQPSAHDQRLPGYVAVDTALLEAPVAPAAEATGTGAPSTTLTLPLLVTPYVFLFGQPHPGNPSPSAHEAGEGPFGANPAAGGTPVTDLDGACGDRTEDCRLITPADLKRYDPYADELSAAGVTGVGEVARLCLHTGTFTYEHPKPDTRLCGTDGRPMNEFLGATTDGGLGVDGAPTWLNTLPGWYRASVIAPGGALGSAVGTADAYVDDPAPESVEHEFQRQDFAVPPSEDTEGDRDPSIPAVYAVNPAVPLPGRSLDCLTPNVLAEGSGGVYGDYRADAVDLDVHASPTAPAEQALLDATHDDVRPVVATAEDVLPGREADPSLPLVPDDVEAALAEGLDRADPLAGEPAEDPGPREFKDTRPEGLSCTPEGELVHRESPETLDGHLRFQADLVANTANDKQIPSFPQPPGVHPKDPTDGGGAPPASGSDASAWYPDVYGLEGSIHAVLDANANDRLDPCADQQTSGPADPCLWKAVWDAYNPACRGPDGQTTCGTILDRRGYDLEAGVGLYATVTVTGPVAFADEDPRDASTAEQRTRVLGTERPAAQSCLVATSTGFAPRLAASLGVAQHRLADTLCPDVEGDTALVPDGFADQTADPARAGATVEPGDVDLDVNWVPLTPTPAAGEDAAGLGHADQACIGGVFHVQDGQVADDTADSLRLSGANHFTDCVDL